MLMTTCSSSHLFIQPLCIIFHVYCQFRLMPRAKAIDSRLYQSDFWHWFCLLASVCVDCCFCNYSVSLRVRAVQELIVFCGDLHISPARSRLQACISKLNYGQLRAAVEALEVNRAARCVCDLLILWLFSFVLNTR